ncbi:MAG: 7-cyano-7-deazaguanine synthase QueC [Woeseiaceae bacterium]
MSKAKAIVLLSGGLDSSTILAMAKQAGYDCYCVSFDYGQRHDAELGASKRIATLMGCAEHRVMGIDFAGIGGSALTDENLDVPEEPGDGIPITYVPARNTVFLSMALGWAEVIGAEAIFIGVNSVDYSGYPDCRPEFIEAYQSLIALATRAGVNGEFIALKTPLMHLSKAEIITKGINLGVDYSKTVSCYQADAEGRACGRCDACRLRRIGFEEAGVPDPTPYQPAYAG